MEMRHVLRIASVVLAATMLHLHRQAFPAEGDLPSFAYGFEGYPLVLQGLPGEVKTFEMFTTLTTLDNPSPDGAQGWTFALSIDGNCIVSSFAIKGIIVSTIYDEDADGDFQTPELIHHDPYFHDLGDSFTNVAAKCNGPEGKGALSAVVMKGQEKMVLQPNGTQRIGKLRIQTIVPEGSECAPLLLRYVNIGRGFCGVTYSQPINSVVTFEGRSMPPEFGSATILVCPSRFRRGDANSDGVVDISDAVTSLGYLYLGGETPGCLKAADANDDGQVDISDPVLTLTDLFSPQGGTLIPLPGPFECGTDPSPDTLFCLDPPACP